MRYIGEIELTAEERTLLESITLNPENFDDAANLANEKAIPELMESLLTRKAIPEHRVQYFEDLEFRKGRVKGSHRSLFERNNTRANEIYQHPHFRKYLRYFLFGADLPQPVINDFRSEAERLAPVGPSDAVNLSELAKTLVRKHKLQPQKSWEEFYKLALDCGVYQSHAYSIGETVKKMRVRY